MKITVFYDYICPYCFLTSRNVETLMSEFELDVEWKGIEIHPEFPARGVTRSGNPKSKVLKENIKIMSEENGLEIKLPGFATNSRLALEASEFAKKKGRFSRFHNNVYEAYFNAGLNIGEPEIISDIGENSGLDARELNDCLSQRMMSCNIEQNQKNARDNQIFSVPTILMNEFPLTGNQSLDTLRQVLKRAIERSGPSIIR